MSQNQPPKKSQHSKAKNLILNVKKRWQGIVNDVDKKELPVEVLQRIVVKLLDGSDLSIDIKRLLDDGNDPVDIEDLLNEKFRDLDEYIEKVDFFIDIGKVVEQVQPETDRVLKNI